MSRNSEVVRVIRHGEPKIIYPTEQEQVMKRIHIQSVNSGGEYEVEIIIPHMGTSTQTRRDATGDRFTLRMDRDLHHEFLNAASQWVHTEAEKHDAGESE